jgi:hypothetical protein
VREILRKGLVRILPIPLGLVLVALATAWSIHNPIRASMTVEDRSYSLGTTPGGAYQRHSWVIRNGGSIPLKLRTHFTQDRCGFSLWLGQDYFVPAGGRLTVSLTCPTPRRSGAPYSGHADVFTDDPDSPSVRFRVFGVTGLSTVP